MMGIHNELNRYKNQLSQLVAAPSVSCSDAAWDMSNHKVIELLAGWLDELNFDCNIHPIDGHPGKHNLVATYGQGNDGLVLAGHSDTVPFDPERWSSEPFQLAQKENRLYGLGATDMKGFFPVVLAAITRILPAELNQPIIFLATADEESSMSGARSLIDQNFPQAKFAVIGEPTGMRPISMHKGILMEAIRVNGKAGHSSNPSLGNNSIDVINDVIYALKRFREKLAVQYKNSAFEISIPTLNFGCIHGGDNPNRICSDCELHFDIRLMPGMEMEQIRRDVQQILKPIAETSGSDIVFSALFPGVPAFEQDKNSEIIQTVQKLTGHQAKSVAFATEAPFLQAMNMQAVVMGPGSIDQAHQADEYIPLDEVPDAINIIESLIRKYCCA